MTSPYPELKALSDEERAAYMRMATHDLVEEAESLHYMEPHEEEAKESIKLAQQYLDRIKQLVLTRGSDENTDKNT